MGVGVLGGGRTTQTITLVFSLTQSSDSVLQPIHEESSVPQINVDSTEQ